MFDLSFLRTIRGAVIMAPRNENELRHMHYTAIESPSGPFFIRYPRGAGDGIPLEDHYKKLPIGVPKKISEGKDIAIISIGNFFHIAKEVCNNLKSHGYNPAIIDAQFVKPLDKVSYSSIFSSYSVIVSIENNSVAAGFGAALLELANELDLDVAPNILRFGLPDVFVTHGDLDILLRNLNLDAESITSKTVSFLTKHLSVKEFSNS
jgi:1-deoxy-D-xylulose-5-phosphate synthase